MNFLAYIKPECSIELELPLTPKQDSNDFTPTPYIEVKRESLPNGYILHNEGHLELRSLGPLPYIHNPQFT